MQKLLNKLHSIRVEAIQDELPLKGNEYEIIRFEEISKDHNGEGTRIQNGVRLDLERLS